jgi:hypothetical protein
MAMSRRLGTLPAIGVDALLPGALALRREEVGVSKAGLAATQLLPLAVP